VPHQDDSVELLGFDKCKNVANMGAQSDVGRNQVGALADTRQSDCVGFNMGQLQALKYTAPAPAAMPGAMYQNDSS
jgi:hypothetical protein